VRERLKIYTCSGDAHYRYTCSEVVHYISMYLHWKTRRKQRWWEEVTHVASLVQSVRIAGAVRQQHLAYLGSLVATRGQSSPRAVRHFWQQAEHVFATLSLSPEQSVRLRAAITQRIGPRPSDEELQQDWNKVLAELSPSVPLSSLIKGRERWRQLKR